MPSLSVRSPWLNQICCRNVPNWNYWPDLTCISTGLALFGVIFFFQVRRNLKLPMFRVSQNECGQKLFKVVFKKISLPLEELNEINEFRYLFNKEWAISPRPRASSKKIISMTFWFGDVTKDFRTITVKWRSSMSFLSTCRLFQIAYEGKFRSLCTYCDLLTKKKLIS